MDDMLRRYDAGLDGSLCVEIGPVLSCLSVHDGPHMLRFQAEPFPVNRLDLFGKAVTMSDGSPPSSSGNIGL